MTTISDGTTTLHPLAWMDYQSSREAGTRTHRLASGRVALTLAKAGPRRVTIALLFDDEDVSARCEAMLATPGVLTITEDGRDSVPMQFVVVGRIERELDPDTDDAWIVSAEVQEVAE